MDTQFLAKVPKWMQVGLVLLWIVAGVGVAIAFFTPQDWAAIPGGIAGALFIIGLCWALIKIPPCARALPKIKLEFPGASNFWLVLGLIIIVMAAFYALGLLIDPAFVLIGGSALLAVAVIIILRDDLTWDLIITGAILGIVVGFTFRFLEFNELSWSILNLIAVAVMYVAGALLVKRSKLGKISWMSGNYLASLSGFGLALLLAIPAASLNLIGEIYTGDTWVQSWWQAFAAIAPGIGEEVWARLFLVTLFYILLRPSVPQNAGRAILFSVIISSLVHALAHTGFNFVAIIFGLFFYGIPPALLFIKRDLEHAIGYHFMIDFVRFLAAAIFAAG